MFLVGLWLPQQNQGLKGFGKDQLRLILSLRSTIILTFRCREKLLKWLYWRREKNRQELTSLSRISMIQRKPLRKTRSRNFICGSLPLILLMSQSYLKLSSLLFKALGMRTQLEARDALKSKKMEMVRRKVIWKTILVGAKILNTLSPSSNLP